METLLLAGASVFAKNDDLNTPLHLACYSNAVTAMEVGGSPAAVLTMLWTAVLTMLWTAVLTMLWTGLRKMLAAARMSALCMSLGLPARARLKLGCGPTFEVLLGCIEQRRIEGVSASYTVGEGCS